MASMWVTHRGLLSRDMAMMLDAIGKRYGVRPSSIVGLDPSLGASVLFDIQVLSIVSEIESEANTVGGKIDAKRRQWSPEVKREIEEQGLRWR